MNSAKPIGIKGLRLKRKIGSAFRILIVAGLLGISSHFHEDQPLEWNKPSAFASDPLDFEATAYCLTGVTKSGFPVGPGVVAADPKVLPLGSLIWVEVPGYRGAYQVMDTGELVQGRIIDIYLPDEDRALEFGRRKVKVIVLRYGPHGKLSERAT